MLNNLSFDPHFASIDSISLYCFRAELFRAMSSRDIQKKVSIGTLRKVKGDQSSQTVEKVAQRFNQVDDPPICLELAVTLFTPSQVSLSGILPKA